MGKLPDYKFYQNALINAKKKVDDYLTKKKHNYDLYNFKDTPKGKKLQKQYNVEHFNQVYSIIESQNANIGFKHPKVKIQAARPEFYTRKVLGNRDIEEISAYDMIPVYKQMKQLEQVTGQPVDRIVIPEEVNGEEGVEVEYRIIKGRQSALILEKALNQYNTDKGTEIEMEKVKNDVSLTPCGAAWVDYFTPFYFPMDESEFIKEDDIVTTYEEIGKTVLFDPSIGDLTNLQKGKWVAKKFFITIDDLPVLKDVEGPDGEPLFKTEALDKLETAPPSEMHVYQDGYDYGNDDRISDKNKVDDRILGFNFWQFIIKPSKKERLSEDGKFKNGKVLYIVENYDGEISNPYPIQKKMDEFPLEILWFNIPNGRLFPISDIEVYEPLLLEYDIIKALQRELTDISSRIKLAIDTSDINSKDIPKLKQQLQDVNNRIIAVEGLKKENIYQINMGSQNSSVWTFDGKIRNEINQAALTSGANMQIARASVSATAEAVADRAANSRTQSRQYKVAKFWEKIISKQIALMQQYYDDKRMVQLTGDLNSSNAWAEFSREDIQGEYLVSIDVMSMNPGDVQTQVSNLIQMLNLTLGTFDNPARYLKLLSEGKQLNLSEQINDIMKHMDIDGNKILPEVDPVIRSNASQLLSQQLQLGGAGGSTGNPNAVSGIAPQQSESVGATGGPEIAPGQTSPSGGDIKV